MTDDKDARRAAFISWMEANDTNVKKVSERSGVPLSTLYDYARGRVRSIKADLARRIADSHGTTIAAIFESVGAVQTEVLGRIGARAEVRPFDEAEPMYSVDLAPGMAADEGYLAFEIEGVSMPPARPGWVVFFRKRELPLEELIGFPCLVDLEDGRRLFKVLRRGYSPDRWNLESWDGSPLIEDETVLRALPFASMTPGRMGR